MLCPFCTHGKTVVIDGSWDEDHQTIKRRRICLYCKYSWTTLEIDMDQVDILDNLKRSNNPPKGGNRQTRPTQEDGDN